MAECLNAMRLTMLPLPDKCPRCVDGPCVAGVPDDKLATAIEAFKLMGFSEDQAKEFMDDKLREIAPKGNG